MATEKTTQKIAGVIVEEEVEETKMTKATKKGPKGPQAGRKKKTTQKATPKKKASTGAPSAKGGAKKPSSKMTVAQLADSYLAHLEVLGKNESTVRSYRGDLNVAIRELGGDTLVSSLTKTKVKNYFESDAICKTRDGKPRSQITIDKQRRVFRMALVWRFEVVAGTEAPVPDMKKAPKKGKMLDAAIAEAKEGK